MFIRTSVGNATTGGSTYDFSTFFFAGLISDTPFTTATFGSLSLIGGSSFNVDNLTYASVPKPLTVPEPGSMFGLIALGALGVASKFNQKISASEEVE